MLRQYCTYFDHRYLSRALAMMRSLRRVEPAAEIFALCMSDQAYEYFAVNPEPGVRPVALSEFESGDEELLRAKHDGRSAIEYYFTCTPSLIRYGFRLAPEAQFMTYLDADLWFFSAPDALYQRAKNAAAIIIPHRFPPEHYERTRFGIFNVGWVTFRRDEEGLRLLEWWRKRCLEWCFDRVDEENDRFADQRYLDRFPELSTKVYIVVHKGANLAPWNMGGYQLSERDSTILIDDRDPLIFFHFHGLKALSSQVFLTGQKIYHAQMSSLIKEKIYRPYLNELCRISRYIGTNSSPLRSIYGEGGSDFVSGIKSAVTIVRALRANSLIWVETHFE